MRGRSRLHGFADRFGQAAGQGVDDAVEAIGSRIYWWCDQDKHSLEILSSDVLSGLTRSVFLPHYRLCA